MTVANKAKLKTSWIKQFQHLRGVQDAKFRRRFNFILHIHFLNCLALLLLVKFQFQSTGLCS
jgi:hypothetical protein